MATMVREGPGRGSVGARILFELPRQADAKAGLAIGMQMATNQ